MKKIILIIVGCLLVSGLAVFAAWRYLAPEYMASKITSECKALGLSEPMLGSQPVLSFFPPAIMLDNITWEYGESLRIKVVRAAFELEPAPLLSGHIEFRNILLDGAEVAISDSWPTRTANAASRTSQAANLPFLIKRLVIQNGKITILHKSKSILLENIKLTAENIQIRKDMEIKCDFTISLQNKSASPRQIGNLAINSTLQFYPPNLNFRHAATTFTQVNDEFLHFLTPVQLKLSGSYNFDNTSFRLNDTVMRLPQGRLKVSGDGQISPGSFSGNADFEADLKHIFSNESLRPEFAIITSPIKLTSDGIKLSDIALRIGETTGSGNLDFTSGESGISKIAGFLKTGFMQFYSQEKQSRVNKPAPEEGSFQNASFQNWPELDLKLEADGIALNNIVIQDTVAAIYGKKGNYKTNGAGFSWCEGKVDFVGALNLPSSESTLTASASNLNFGKIITQLGLEGFEDGVASLKINLRTKAASLQGILNSLTGNGLVEVRNAKLNLLENIVDTLSFFSRKLIDYSGTSLTAPFVVQKGIVDISPITIASSNLSATGNAAINIEKLDLNSRLNFKIGPIAIPLKFSGPLGDISIGVDMTGRDN